MGTKNNKDNKMFPSTKNNKDVYNIFLRTHFRYVVFFLYNMIIFITNTVGTLFFLIQNDCF